MTRAEVESGAPTASGDPALDSQSRGETESRGEQLVVFRAVQELPHDAPLRVVVPGAESARDPLLAVLRDKLPGHDPVELTSPADGVEGERWLLDWWAGQAPAERARVSCVVGRAASCLMRFQDRPSLGFALLGPPAVSDAPNPQARALLAAAHPDSWTVALDDGPPVDADRWRFRLATALSERWGAGTIDHPIPAFEAMLNELDLSHPLPSPKVMFRIRPDVDPAPGDVQANWLDYELYERAGALTEDGAIEELATDPPHQWAWHRAQVASLERRLRRLENLNLAVDRRNPPGGPDGTPPSALLIDDQAEATARMDPKTVRGKDGWMFLGSDSHDSHAQITGRRLLSEEEIDRWEGGIRTRLDMVASRGSRLVTLFGPAPQVVQADVLPDGVDVARERPVQQVLRRLAVMNPQPAVLYPVAELSSHRHFLSPFPKADSHWNDVGAFLAYEALMGTVAGSVPSLPVHRDQVGFHETVYVGDLGSKLRPERAGVFLRAAIDRPRARLVEDNRVRNHGRMAVYECSEAPPGTCVVFGDSWAYAMLLFLAQSFRRLVFYHRVNVVDEAPIVEHRPDLVIVVLTERFMTALPDDSGAVPFEDVVAKKIRGGHLMPLPPPKTRGPFLHSVQLERGLPTTPGIRLPPRAD